MQTPRQQFPLSRSNFAGGGRNNNTGTAFADFMLGHDWNLDTRVAPAIGRRIKIKYGSGCFHHDWKVTDRLILRIEMALRCRNADIRGCWAQGPILQVPPASAGRAEGNSRRRDRQAGRPQSRRDGQVRSETGLELPRLAVSVLPPGSIRIARW